MAHSWSWCGSCPSRPAWGWGYPAHRPLCSGNASSWLFAPPVGSGPTPPLPILILWSCALWVALGIFTEVTIVLPTWREQSSSVPGLGRAGSLPLPLEMLLF